MAKQYRSKSWDIKQRIRPMGACIATDTITVDGLKVGYMDRYPTDRDNDSGWCFMSGTETQEYMDDAGNMGIYDVNTIANYDPAIMPYINSPYGTSWKRIEGTDEFKEIEQPDLY